LKPLVRAFLNTLLLAKKSAERIPYELLGFSDVSDFGLAWTGDWQASARIY
jgi:hypothetical protein